MTTDSAAESPPASPGARPPENASPARRGVFVTVEGGEGSGKTTLIAGLAQYLTKAGIAFLQTREPGGSPGAEAIRQLLVTGDPARWDGQSETLLLLAARRNHWHNLIAPALKAGKWVVCDRFMDSTEAYQGYGHRLGAAWIQDLARIALGEAMHPDVTLVLDLPVDLGLARAQSRHQAWDEKRAERAEKGQPAAAEDRFERLDRTFHERVRAGFQAIAARDQSRCHVLEAARPAEEVLAAAWTRLEPYLPSEGKGTAPESAAQP